MRLTADERSQIEEIHKKNKKDLHIKNNANFRLLAECRDIRQLDYTPQEIEEERISIRGRSSRFITPQIKEFQNLQVQKYDIFSTPEERAGYPHWFVFVSYIGGISTYKLIADMEYTQEEIGIEIPLMSKWFGINTQQWQQNTSNFAMLMPVYIKQDESLKQKKESWSHRWYISHC